MSVVSASACWTRVGDGVLDLGRGALGARLEALLEDARRTRRDRAVSTRRAIALLVAASRHVPPRLFYLFCLRLPARRRCGHASLSAAISCGSARSFLIWSLGGDLAVHVAQQVRELLARLQQLGQGRDLPRDRGRAEIVHLLEAQVDRELLAGAVAELVVDLERRRRARSPPCACRNCPCRSRGTLRSRPPASRRPASLPDRSAITPITKGSSTAVRRRRDPRR